MDLSALIGKRPIFDGYYCKFDTEGESTLDVLIPFLSRISPPQIPTKRLIAPVLKYQRVHAEPDPEQPFRVGLQASLQQQIHRRQADNQQPEQQHAHQQNPQQQAPQNQNADAPQPSAQKQLLLTGHAVTPEQDQHVDAEGHLDIYI